MLHGYDACLMLKLVLYIPNIPLCSQWHIQNTKNDWVLNQEGKITVYDISI